MDPMENNRNVEEALPILGMPVVVIFRLGSTSVLLVFQTFGL